jgi:hypothetical protein
MNSRSNSSSPQRVRREARRAKRCHQRISLLSLLAMAVSPSFVALYFSSTTQKSNDHHSSSNAALKSLRPPPSRQQHAESSRKTKLSKHEQQPLLPPQPLQEVAPRIDSAPHVEEDITKSDTGIVCQTLAQQPQDITTTEYVCCARWEYNTDDWWLQHYDYEIQHENATHTCFSKITNAQRLAFLHRVEKNQWQSHATKTGNKNGDNNNAGDDATFCAHDVQVNQISTGYAAALTSLTRSFAAALAQNRPFQYNKRHDRFHWNFSIRNPSTNSTNTTAVETTATSLDTMANATSHWAYCPTQDMNCFYLPLGQCRPQLGRHDDGFRGKKPPSAGAAAAAAAAARNNFDTTTATTAILQERLEFLWLRRYAFRPRHVLRHQLYLFLQEHLTPTHQQELARVLENEKYAAVASLQQQQPFLSLSCTAIHVRRGDVAFGKGRRYAAVQEYLDTGNVARGETIVLLTDDASTIEEVQQFHDDDRHSWIFVQRPRFLGSQGGFEGFIPSNDPAFEVLAILADMQLASYCPKLVHGKSGFVDLLVEEREREGKPVQTILLDIQQDKGSQPKLDAKERAEQYLQHIRQKHAAAVSEQ